MHYRHLYACTVIAVSLLGLSACGKSQNDPATEPAPPPAQSTTPPAMGTPTPAAPEAAPVAPPPADAPASS